MITIVTSCPIRTAFVVWQPADGMCMLTVVCKATFDLAVDESPLSEVQDEPLAHDEYWNDDEHASLSGASDIVPFKHGVDVLLVGYAHAPRVLSERPFFARLAIGNAIDKTIEVHGDRQWTKDDRLVENPCPSRMPLRYERAAGGPHTSNPVGVRPVTLIEPGQPRRLPNLEPPRSRLARPTDTPAPIGFGPIAPSWPDRTSKIDRDAGDWDPKSWFLHPLAPHVDASFFNTAPLDQRLETFVGDERIILENLHPDFPRFSTHIAPIRPRAVVHKAGAAMAPLDLRCDTLCIDTDRRVCSLSWRASVPLAHADEFVHVEVSIDDGPRLSAHSNLANSTVMLDWDVQRTRASAPALPFTSVGVVDRPPFNPAEISIERFAAISAELNECQKPRHRILEAHKLHEEDWKTIEAHWTRAIDDESASGKHSLRKASDGAYIAAVEKFRGPITASETARIVASLERGKTNETLDDLKIQRPALMPILRSCARKPARNLATASS